MDGYVVIYKKGICEVFLSYYKFLLGIFNFVDEFDYSIIYKGRVLNDEMKKDLMRFVNCEEIKKVLFLIYDDRVMGYDGFIFCCFKKVWCIVGREMCEVIRDLF